MKEDCHESICDTEESTRCLRFTCPRRCCCPPRPPVCNRKGGSQLQLISPAKVFLANRDIVKFNTILNKSDKDIIYNSETGKFTLLKPSNYLVNWNISLEGTDVTPFVSFSLCVDDKIYGTATAPVATSFLSSSSLITTTNTSTTLELINTTGDTVRLSDVSPMANIVIAKI